MSRKIFYILKNIYSDFYFICDICTGLYIILIMRLITILSNFIAYQKYNNEKSGNPSV